MAYFEQPLLQNAQGGPMTGIDASVNAQEILPQNLDPLSLGYFIRNGQIHAGFSTGGFDFANGTYPITTTPKFIAQVKGSNGTKYAVSMDDTKLYQVKPAPIPPRWNTGTVHNLTLGSNVPVYITINNKMYITAAANQKIISCEPVVGTVANLTTFAGGVYIGELSQHLILVSVTDGTGTFPYRIRWSGVNNIAQFDPTVDATAGFQDLLDVGDNLTGFMTIGRTGYILREQGLTEMTPTNSGTAPFQFDHVWRGEKGIGCLHPYSSAVYGTFGCFVGQDDIYMLSGGGFNRIGGKAVNQIMSDITGWRFLAGFPIFGSVVSYLAPFGNPIGFPYLCYIISIPVTYGTSQGTTILWMYNFATQSWSRGIMDISVLTTPFCNVFDSQGTGGGFYGSGGTTSNYFQPGPAVAGGITSNTVNGLFTIVEDSFDPLSLAGGSLGLFFRTLRFGINKKATIHKIAIDYLATVGNQTATVTDTTELGTQSVVVSFPVTSGTTNATAYANFITVGERHRISITPIGANLPIITQVIACGNDGDGDTL